MTPQSPTGGLLIGLAVTLLAVALFSWHALVQVDGLRQLQTETIDRNRRDSLQLLRIQGNLHNLGLSMRDMVEGASPYPIEAYRVEFDRVRSDLDDAVRTENALAPASRSAGQQAFLQDSLEQFWEAADRMFRQAEAGNEEPARQLIREVMQPRHASLTSAVARFLFMNNEAEQQATEEVQEIYASVERNIYYFLFAAVAAICLTSAYMIHQNRRIFQSISQLSEQRQVLARKLIGVQEEIFQSISRELHDEFGQVLTAVGALLARAQRKGADEAPQLSRDLREVQGIAQETLENVRRLSQRLHPNVLDDYGLEGAVEWYVQQVRDQTGLTITYEKQGEAVKALPTETAIHVYRILQESLNNVVRHANSAAAWVRLRRNANELELEVEDRGVGLPPQSDRRDGLGLVGMRERAELVHGRLVLSRPAEGGTLVHLEVPLKTS
jgi:signal transduction histidine kinase